eukprot:gnl/TRDRNA2_/TRDRNA2_202049_c0_seq1.p1 gnl/TRDRNA2_/TRDRNA2_202049_c0~~gnl/TRDRNA2_/TRDRNA2_202049_c0_seq1.p1  ORF type:complete len:158 (-),score=32.26 gnl/TRDRNA2_/TRDRNA2_202049_c0_seq1:131-604(-)
MGALNCRQCETQKEAEPATFIDVTTNAVAEPPETSLKEVQEKEAPATAPPAPAEAGGQGGEMKEFTVTIDRSNGGALGIEVDWKKTGDSEDALTLNVVGVQPSGLVPEWNSTAPVDQRISKGSRIIKVNDISRTPSTMVAEIRKPQELKLICRSAVP